MDYEDFIEYRKRLFKEDNSYGTDWRSAIPEDEFGISFEEKMDLYDALDHLSNQYREILTLKYFDDMKIKEIAEIMEMPEGSVKAYLSRAKKELREYLKEDYIYGISYR